LKGSYHGNQEEPAGRDEEDNGSESGEAEASARSPAYPAQIQPERHV
jgi:hypothetical protein